MRAAVVGSGAWGTALALRLFANGHEVTLWSHNAEKARQMAQTRENPVLAGVQLPEELIVTGEARSVSGCKLVVIACPSFPIRQVCGQIAPFLDADAVLVSVTKGLEADTLLRMSQIVEEVTGRPVVALTGPSHAEEVARNNPTGCVAACPDKALAEFVQDAFMADSFRVYTSPDIIGAELGGALKNVIALCVGVCDGMGLGDNAKAMLMTRGLTEIARLGVAMGARRETFAGLAGVGDLIVTGTSRHSRNRKAGMLLGQGKRPEEALREVGAVVEGYYCAKSAFALCCKQGVEMPIVEAAYGLLYRGEDASEAVRRLLMRQRRAESEDAGWN
ncbi:MAG TPA: NAD(P)-dependent glycerol-3-phosphate dehydrogenase [Candidatus Faecousia intestinigallinarum]|nr:NAD(P)-dependent glycerol-3-phosphate dehydrogenase [Candidatus Faecousia intestinigallinarum]